MKPMPAPFNGVISRWGIDGTGVCPGRIYISLFLNHHEWKGQSIRHGKFYTGGN